ncbi:MAG: hypothetical protein R3E03_09345 [Novosphingobium sp.]
MERNELLFNRRGFEPGCTQGKPRELPLISRQHGNIAVLAGTERERGQEDANPGMGNGQRSSRASAHCRDQPRGQTQAAAAFIIAAANFGFCRGNLRLTLRVMIGKTAQRHQRGMQQIAGKFGQRQLHPPLGLGKPRLRRKQRHRRRRDTGLARGNQRLEQRREHRIESQTRLEPLGQLPFQRERVDVVEKTGMSHKAFDQYGNIIGIVLTIVAVTRSIGAGIEQLPGEIGHRAPDPGDDLVTEHRVLVVGKQVTQDRRDCADQGIAVRQFVAQGRLDLRGGNRLGSMLVHGIGHSPFWLRLRYPQLPARQGKTGNQHDRRRRLDCRDPQP